MSRHDLLMGWGRMVPLTPSPDPAGKSWVSHFIRQQQKRREEYVQAMSKGRLVGLRDIARELDVTTRQAFAWASRAKANGFPEPKEITELPGYPGDKVGTRRWALDEVVAWRSTYVPGTARVTRRAHALKYEGAPHDDHGLPINNGERKTGGEGRAKCACGELSPVLPSRPKRVDWYNEHVRGIVAK